MGNKYFEIALQKTLKFEGGYSNDINDPGGETKFGITIYTARKFGYKGEMKNMSLIMAEKIYYKMYWQPVKLDDIAFVDQDIANELFDCAINNGAGTAGKVFQTALNILNLNQKLYDDLDIDGIIGKKTISAFNKLSQRQDIWGIYKAIVGLRFKIYFDIVAKKPKQEIFLRSWLRRI